MGVGAVGTHHHRRRRLVPGAGRLHPRSGNNDHSSSEWRSERMAKESERVRRDQAGIGPDPSYTGELVRLDDLRGFKVAEGEPDIRGWDVCTLHGTEIGEVDDLLVDPRRGEVVVLDVDLKGSDRHAEVPVRSVQIDRHRKVVIVDTGEVDGYVSEKRRARLGETERERLGEKYRDTPKR